MTVLPAPPGRVLDTQELKRWVSEFAARPEMWEHHVRHDTGQRHYASVYRDSDIDVWVLCWNVADDTGWHDHDTSSGAVAVTRGAVIEATPRMGGSVDGSVTIHAYSPPLWRMGQYSISSAGVLRRRAVSYADELRPIDE